MKIAKIALLSVLMSSTVAVAATTTTTDLLLQNETGAYATAYAGVSPCSSAAGDRGIIKPHESISVPGFALSLVCASGCEGNIYISKNCGGSKIATVTISDKKTVTHITNHNVNGYVVSASGDGLVVKLTGGPAKKWYNFIFG